MVRERIGISTHTTVALHFFQACPLDSSTWRVWCGRPRSYRWSKTSFKASIFIKLVIKHIKLHVMYQWLLCYRSILLPAAAIRYNRLEPCIVPGYLTQTIERVNIHLYSLSASKVTWQEHSCLRIHIRCQYQRVLEKQACKTTTESSSNSISSSALNEVKFNTVSCYPTTVVLHRKKILDV